MGMTEDTKEWHLDRKVTIGIILALLANATSSVWWASRLDYTVQNHEVRLLDHDKTLETLRVQGNGTIERLARIEENIKYQTEMVREIKQTVTKNVQ